jgi:hypothetical protein
VIHKVPCRIEIGKGTSRPLDAIGKRASSSASTRTDDPA